jgi:hypothetical protein
VRDAADGDRQVLFPTNPHGAWSVAPQVNLAITAVEDADRGIIKVIFQPLGAD